MATNAQIQTSQGDPALTATTGSPITGTQSAVDAGSNLLASATRLWAIRARRGVRLELPAYLSIQGTWFIAFGLQMVLFPYLITNKLGLDGTELGIANFALAGPSVIFLLIGGVIAERAPSKPLLFILHLCAAIPALGLAYILATGQLTYAHLLIYGVALGTVGAFMMPARDAVQCLPRHRQVASSYRRRPFCHRQ